MPRSPLGFFGSLLLIAHLVIAATIIFNLSQKRQQRSSEVEQLRHIATAEAQETAAHQRELDVYQALLEGLRNDDPYVIELLARDRLGYRHRERHEVPPPRLEAPQQ